MESMHNKHIVKATGGVGARYCRTREHLVDDCGVVHPLRNQSLKVLQLLANNQETILSKSAIHEAIWNTVAVTDDSLVQCISDIRKGLDDRNRSILKTFPRQGYLLTQAAFLTDHPSTIADDEADRSELSLLNRYKDRVIRSRNNLRYAAGVLGIGLILLHGLSAIKPTGSTGSSRSSNSQATDTIKNDSATNGLSYTEINQRNYEDRGMPYWNNRFLWDGYYLDSP